MVIQLSSAKAEPKYLAGPVALNNLNSSLPNDGVCIVFVGVGHFLRFT